MLTKILVFYPCGIIRTVKTKPVIVFRGLVRRGQYPRLIEFYGSDFDDEDKEQILVEAAAVIDPKIGIITVNGKDPSDIF